MTALAFRAFAADRRPHTALVHRDVELTGDALDRQAEVVAGRLDALGVGPGHRVALALGNTPLFAAGLLAAMKLQASAVLLNPQFKQQEVADCLERTDAAALLTATDAVQGFTHLPSAASAESLALSDAPGALHVWRRPGAGPRAARGERIVQLTSGVSGRSKIVCRTEEHLACELTSFASHLALGPDDATVCPAPLFHAYGLINGLLLPLFSGRPAILIDWFLPNDVVAVARRHRPRVLVGVPAMYRTMAEAFGPEAEDLASLRICFSAGAPLTREIADAFRARFRRDINQQYGSTETGVMAVNLLDRPGVNPLAAGRAVGCEIAIAGGADAGVGGEAGETGGETGGEIIVRSAAAATAYLDDPALSAERFRDGRYFTGDLGAIDASGDLVILGRRTSFINVAGLKVDPREVERVLASCEAVADCAVVGAPEPSSGEIVKAVIVARREVSPKVIQQYCRQRLAAYKVPREVAFVDALPRSATGKVLTKYLLDL